MPISTIRKFAKRMQINERNLAIKILRAMHLRFWKAEFSQQGNNGISFYEGRHMGLLWYPRLRELPSRVD